MRERRALTRWGFICGRLHWGKPKPIGINSKENRMRSIRLASAAAFGSLLTGSIAHSQEITRAFLCENLAGSYSGPATSWRAEQDGASNQQVLLYFKGGKAISNVKWYRDGKPYYEANGVGTTMKSGFGITVFDDEYIETYVFNVGTSELLFSMVRSGSSQLPNAMKSMRGTCKPAGSMVR